VLPIVIIIPEVGEKFRITSTVPDEASTRGPFSVLAILPFYEEMSGNLKSRLF